MVLVRQLEQAELERDEGRRATWLETRNLEENFKQLVYLSMQEVNWTITIRRMNKHNKYKCYGHRT